MDIIEDLNLIDFPDDMLDGMEFDLEDILFEFSTPGLYSSPTSAEADHAARQEDVEEVPQREFVFDFEDIPGEAEPAEQPEAAPAEAPVPLPEEEDSAVFVPDDATIAFAAIPEEPMPRENAGATMVFSAIEEDTLVYAPGEAEEDVPIYIPAADLEPEEDVQVYVPGEDPCPALDVDTLETVPFTAVADLEVPAPPAKAPGLLTKIAGLFAGLFAGKKKAPVQPVSQPAPAPAADPFAGVEELFAARDMAGYSYGYDDEDMDMELLLELEMEAAREAESQALAAEAEANAAALEANEQIALTPEPELEIPAAVLEVQQEQEDFILNAALEAELLAEQLRLEEEESGLAAQTEAQLAAREAEALRLAEAQRLAEEAEDAPLSPEEEAKLFAWLDSLSPADTAPATIADMPVEAIPWDAASPLQPEYAPQPEYVSAFTPDTGMEDGALIPELSIDEEEQEPPVSEEDLETILEDSTVSRSIENEDPAEAAARRAKEDEELRYVPDETPAQAVASAISGRFGAAFAAFTHADTDPGEDEEALGPEVPPSKAYRFFDKYVNGYRFRLRVSVAMSIITAWISLGLPVLGSLKNPAVAAAACLMLQLVVMLAGADILATGVRSLLRRKPGLHGMLFLSCAASVVDACVIIFTRGTAGYLPFCGVSTISMCFAIYGSLMYCRGQRFTFRALELAAEPLTISVDYGIVDDETTTAYRAPGYPEQFIHRSEEEDLSETVYGIMGPALTVAIPVLALVAALASKHLGDFFHIMAAMFAAASSFGALVAFPLPYFLVQRDLYAAKAAIAGWAGTKEIGRVATMIVTDRDLFPDETVSIDSVRIVDSVPPELTLSYFCSLILKSGSCLAPAFTQLAENNDCEILPVEDFRCHEAGGLSGTIGPDDVLVASHSYMKLQGLRIPARKKDSENALFLAVNGHVIAYIMVNYRALKSVREGLESAISGNVELVFAARDFNVTPLLISKKFKSPTDTLRFPSYNQRFEITEHGGSDTATCAAVVSRKSFYSYAMVVKKARNLYSSVSWATILSALSSLLGVILMFVMGLSGAGAAVTVGRLLIFMLLFAAPTLALCVSITK